MNDDELTDATYKDTERTWAAIRPRNQSTQQQWSSPEIEELATALAQAQAEIKDAELDSTNPFFKHGAYATLASCWAAIRDPFGKNSLAVTQLTRLEGDETPQG